MQLLFRIVKDYGTSIIMATHDYPIIKNYPSRTLTTERGKVLDSANVPVVEA